jgi:hypothetical protein
VSLPELSHSMGLQECISHLGASPFYVKSRFAVCSGHTFNQVWIVDGEPTGTGRVLKVGSAPRHASR